MKICPLCKTPNGDFDIFCRNCRASLAGAQIITGTYPQSNEMPRPKPSMLKLVILLIVSAVFGTSLAVVSLVLSCVSISYYLKYEDCVKCCDFAGAADYTQKINKYYKLGLIFAVIGVTLTILAVVVTVALFGFAIFTDPTVIENFKAIFSDETVSVLIVLN